MIPVSRPSIGTAEREYLMVVLQSGRLTMGEQVAKFEEEFAAYCDAESALACSSGTAALHLALLACGVGPGDEVIIPAITFIATANAVRYCGATPVIVDIHPGNWCIDPTLVRAAVTSKTKAIIPVHLYGQPCDMDAINAIAADRGLIVIEDAAQAHGAEYKGRKVGSLGDMACFSFYGSKVITTGEGGAVVFPKTSQENGFRERAYSLRGQGEIPGQKYFHDRVGYNYRMTDMQAAIGRGQLARADHLSGGFRRVARAYASELYQEIRSGLIGIQKSTPSTTSADWLFVIALMGGKSSSEIADDLSKFEIETRPVFTPIHKQPPHATDQALPAAEDLARRGLCLPTYSDLGDDRVRFICSRLRLIL